MNLNSSWTYIHTTVRTLYPLRSIDHRCVVSVGTVSYGMLWYGPYSTGCNYDNSSCKNKSNIDPTMS